MTNVWEVVSKDLKSEWSVRKHVLTEALVF